MNILPLLTHPHAIPHSEEFHSCTKRKHFEGRADHFFKLQLQWIGTRTVYNFKIDTSYIKMDPGPCGQFYTSY